MVFITDEQDNALRTELKNFLKCIKNDAGRFLAICDLDAIDGGRIDECCEVIEEQLIYRIMRDAIKIIIADKPINGKLGNWNSGCFGSRWLDMDAKPYGLDHIRCAFYSKKYNSNGCNELPYRIVITCEKAK